jgi:hypothetical protein
MAWRGSGVDDGTQRRGDDWPARLGGLHLVMKTVASASEEGTTVACFSSGRGGVASVRRRRG